MPTDSRPPPSRSASLPVDAVLPALQDALGRHRNAVLVAPPGAGKTTRVPLALLEAAWRGNGKILVLEPRRLAARAAAGHMARSLAEPLGRTIGLRIRSQSLVSAETRVEIVTDGVFARMILADPSLAGTALVIFDEFHERSLDADLGLALCLDAQAGLREDLRILVMSATLDDQRIARLLGEATPVIVSQGRHFPVETRYVGRDPSKRLEEEVARCVVAAHGSEPGSILVFLPGQAEIQRVAALLATKLRAPATDVVPLYGGLDRAAQELAIAPASAGRRKIVLASSIAETSLTIEGIRLVIDSGLARVPRYEPDIGMTRLETLRVSQAAADQRRGRAGRTAPGLCYRLWEAAGTAALEPFARPEILSADLSGLLLDLAHWGVSDPAQLPFLDLPPRPACARARAFLMAIGALDADGRLSGEGQAIRSLALPPRLARMVVLAARHNQASARLAAEIAAVLVERWPGRGTDVGLRVEALGRDRSPHGTDVRRLAKAWVHKAWLLKGPDLGGDRDEPGWSAGRLLALAYPDRLAKARGRNGEFVMANGRAARVEADDPLAGENFLVVAEVSGRADSARILSAARLAAADIETVASDRLAISEEVFFDPASASVRVRKSLRLGAILLREQPLPAPADLTSAEALARGIAKLGLERLPWSKTLNQWRQRIGFLYRSEPETWPDLSDTALAQTVDAWLAPFLLGKSRLAEVSTGDLEAGLRTLVPAGLTQRLEREAPACFQAPSGARIAIDYAPEDGPRVSLRVQEVFGLAEHPKLGLKAVPLTLALLSPANRIVQITRDLPGFWAGSWRAVRAEMKGRYPRHLWPDDPLQAGPTQRARPRGA
jgi:ATP-dependent helicase HrpB